MGKQWKQWETIFLGSKITVNSDCSHEMKICLLLGRKTMTNLDSILKSRDIVLLTKIRIVKAMVFLSSYVWMWELDHKESWAPKNWSFWIVVLKKTLENPLDCKEIQLVNPKGNQSWIFIARTNAETEAPEVWPLAGKNWHIRKYPDAGKDWIQEENGRTEAEMVGWHHWLDGHESEQALEVGDGQGHLAHCSPWLSKRQTWMSEWIVLKWTLLPQKVTQDI